MTCASSVILDNGSPTKKFLWRWIWAFRKETRTEQSVLTGRVVLTLSQIRFSHPPIVGNPGGQASRIVARSAVLVVGVPNSLLV